jgi:flagellar protein FlgJ
MLKAMAVRLTVAAACVAAIPAGLLAPAAHAQTPPAKGTVLSPDRTTINARDVPGGAAQVKLRHGRRLRITCQISGPVASGPSGRSNIWDRVVVGSQRLYVADALMRTAGTGVLVAKLCGAPGLDPVPNPGATSGACGITSPVAQLPPFPSRADFIRAAVPGAQQSARATQVPASVTLAQAILETGSGTIAAGANNYFGIKAKPLPDQPAGVYEWGVNGVGCVLRKTGEVIGGRSVITIGAFRAYRTLDASIEDHGARLLANEVYKSAFAYADRPEKFARIIARHYATDPRYADKVVALMRGEKLTRYDVTPTASADPDPSGGGVSPST